MVALSDPNALPLLSCDVSRFLTPEHLDHVVIFPSANHGVDI